MTVAEQLILIAVCALATMLTRFLPFLVFGEKRKMPSFVTYLGKVLPPAVFGMLVVYCLKDVTPLSYSYGLPEAISVLAVILLHLWKRNTLLSIGFGTVCYMLLISFVFV